MPLLRMEEAGGWSVASFKTDGLVTLGMWIPQTPGCSVGGNFSTIFIEKELIIYTLSHSLKVNKRVYEGNYDLYLKQNKNTSFDMYV